MLCHALHLAQQLLLRKLKVDGFTDGLTGAVNVGCPVALDQVPLRVLKVDGQKVEGQRGDMVEGKRDGQILLLDPSVERQQLRQRCDFEGCIRPRWVAEEDDFVVLFVQMGGQEQGGPG